MTTSIIKKQLPKSGTLENFNIYIMNTPVFYASVYEVKPKYNDPINKEFSLQAFVDEATKDQLIDEVMLNKTFAEVGVTKTTKAPRRIKFPTSSQVEEGKVNYDVVKGMYGFTVAKPEFSKAGNAMKVNVVDKEGNAFAELIGNGSVVNLKLFGYLNKEGQLNVTLDTVQVLEHVPYTGKTASDSVDDDVLGVSYKVQKAEAKVEEKEEAAQKSQPKPTEAFPDADEDLDVPF